MHNRPVRIRPARAPGIDTVSFEDFDVFAQINAATPGTPASPDPIVSESNADDTYSEISKIVMGLANPIVLSSGKDLQLLLNASKVEAETKWSDPTEKDNSMLYDVKLSFIVSALPASITWTNIITTPVVTFGDDFETLSLMSSRGYEPPSGGGWEKSYNNTHTATRANTPFIFDPSLVTAETLYGIMIECKTRWDAHVDSGHSKFEITQSAPNRAIYDKS